MSKDNLIQRNQRTLRTTTQISVERKKSGAVPCSYYWWPITEVKIRQAVRKIVDAVHPEKIILFGSFAEGQPTPDSDVDLLVIMESDRSVNARSVQLSEILYPRPFPVDIIVRTPAEVAEQVRLGDRFTRDILERGKVLYERTSR